MIVYRVSTQMYVRNLSGEGARLFGGRWNKPLTACLYTSESRALAILEYTVNIDVESIPSILNIAVIEFPEQNIIEIKNEQLPSDWKSKPVPASTQNLGTGLFQRNVFGIKVPSVVIPTEYNYLLNPLHPLSTKIKILAVEEIEYDLRIKK